MCSKSQLETILQEVYKKSDAEFGSLLDSVILYGSYARGDFDDESDIDIMVKVRLTQARLKPYEWAFAVLSSRLSLTHDVTVSIHLQDHETFEQYRDVLPFFGNISREGRLFNAG